MGTADEVVEQYIKDASRIMQREERKKAREERERLRKLKEAEKNAINAQAVQKEDMGSNSDSKAIQEKKPPLSSKPTEPNVSQQRELPGSKSGRMED
jgi:hypothetical protein